jgi:hypothetical protein
MDAAVANAISMDAFHLRCQSATTDVVAALAERHDVRWGCIERLDDRYEITVRLIDTHAEEVQNQ